VDRIPGPSYRALRCRWDAERFSVSGRHRRTGSSAESAV